MLNITEILPRYTRLNVLISEISDSHTIEFEQQRFLTDFHTQFSDIQPFETMLIDLVVQTEAEQCGVLLQSLGKEIQRTAQLISVNKQALENIDVKQAYEKFAKQYDTQIANQIHITQEIWKEYKKADNSLDTIGFRKHSEQEEERLWEKHEALAEKYNSEKAILNDLYEKQETVRRIAEKYQENYFSKILSLSHKLDEITQKYIPKTTQNLPEGTYFDMAKSSTIYRICNNTIFENLSETDFYSAINLLASNQALKLKQGEKTRACFLVYKMYESIKSDKKTEWRTSILQQLEIDENYYKSKYKEPISEVPSRKSEQFATEINEVFK